VCCLRSHLRKSRDPIVPEALKGPQSNVLTISSRASTREQDGDFDNALEPKRANSVDKSSLLEPTTPARFGKPVDAAYLDTQAKERQWQLEREAVSRQIQNAYADQIVIISSDGIDEDAASVHTKEKRPARVEGDGLDCRDPNETCGDIWLAEAEAHKSPQDQIGRTSPDFPLQSKSDKGKEQEKRLTSQGEV
jgi:hypothetical protein